MATELAVEPALGALKRYFALRDEVAFAFLFGSQARRTANPLSDVDVAVYFRPKQKRPLECESEVFYPTEETVWADLERLLGREVEMMVLNRARASVAASAISGVPLAINDVRQYLDFAEVVTFEAIDFREMLIQDFLDREALCRRS